MKMKIIAGLALALGLSNVALAEEVQDWYLAGHLGVNHLASWPAAVDFGGVEAAGRLALSRGSHAGLMLGRQSEHARLELELAQGRFRIERMALADVSEAVSAHGKYQALLANLYRHDALSRDWRAFAGVGIGWGKVDLPGLQFSSGCACLGDASRRGAVYQGRVGLAYQPAGADAIALQASYLSLPGPVRETLPSVRYGRRGVTAVTLSYTHYF